LYWEKKKVNKLIIQKVNFGGQIISFGEANNPQSD
jgi:hypothetical protein